MRWRGPRRTHPDLPQSTLTAERTSSLHNFKDLDDQGSVRGNIRGRGLEQSEAVQANEGITYFSRLSTGQSKTEPESSARTKERQLGADHEGLDKKYVARGRIAAATVAEEADRGTGWRGVSTQSEQTEARRGLPLRPPGGGWMESRRGFEEMGLYGLSGVVVPQSRHPSEVPPVRMPPLVSIFPPLLSSEFSAKTMTSLGFDEFRLFAGYDLFGACLRKAPVGFSAFQHGVVPPPEVLGRYPSSEASTLRLHPTSNEEKSPVAVRRSEGQLRPDEEHEAQKKSEDSENVKRVERTTTEAKKGSSRLGCVWRPY